MMHCSIINVNAVAYRADAPFPKTPIKAGEAATQDNRICGPPLLEPQRRVRVAAPLGSGRRGDREDRSMSGANAFKFLMLPPQNDLYRAWAARLAAEVPEARIVLVEDDAAAAREIVDADAAFGRLPADLLAKGLQLRWLQAPQIAPAAVYYYDALIEHPLKVTNFREIFNDHISAHIMAFVLAFARGLHIFIPRQARREWKKSS